MKRKHFCVTYPPTEPVAACGISANLGAKNATRVHEYVTCANCKRGKEYLKGAGHLKKRENY